MVVRPTISDATMDRLNEAAGAVMAVEPEDTSIERRLEVVLDHYVDSDGGETA